MKADTLQLLGDLIGSNKVLFRIPVYQRNYDWSESNCNRLLDDIKAIIDTGEKHFLGTIVYMGTDGNDFVLHDYIIIDGQQRLTTVMILLKALYDIAETNGDDSTMSDIQDYLQNRNCQEDYKIKLKPIKSDNDQFMALLEKKDDELNDEGHIARNYVVCKERMESWVKNDCKAKDILRALHKLEIVGIALKQGEDDPQIIFESINSTGLELSNADLIRNFLLMSDHNQDQLFEDYWLPIEKALKKNTDYTDLNMFFSQYVIYKTSMPINEKRLYQSFVKLFKETGFTHESCLQELKYFSEIFQAFVDPSCKKYNARVRKYLQSLRVLKQTTCYPFLLHVFDDYENNVIDEEALENTVKFILTYLLRRAVCGVPTNTLRGLFIYLYSRVFKVSSNKKKYYESINKFLTTLTSRDLMPSEQEFKDSLLRGNLYGNSYLCRFLMMDIENGDSKEVLKADNLTIEHIMPQTLTMDWRKLVTEDEHETWINTLGNLSVTGYNSEMSNKKFSDKVKIIKENSKAVVLNQDVWDQETWTVDQIKARAKRLSKIVVDRYKVKKIDDPDIEFEYLTKISIADGYSAVTKKKLVSFTFNGETYRQNRYALMLLDVVKLLDELEPDKLEILAKENYSFNNTYKNRSHITMEAEKLRWPWEVRDGIFIEANLSAANIMHFIDSLMGEYQFDPAQFYVSIATDEPDDEDSNEEDEEEE